MFKYRKAVLIIHGFAGGTYDQEALFFHLQPMLEFDVFNFTLPGHMTNLSTDVKYQDWIKAVDDRIIRLTNMGYNKIYLIGHSMGGILAAMAATNHDIVKKVVLVAPAFQILSLKNENTFVKALKNGPEIIKTYQPKEVISRFLKVSLPQMKEFEKLVEICGEIPSKIKVPTLIIHGTSDQIVPFDSSRNVYDEMICPKWRIEIADVTHDVFYGIKVEKICKEIGIFLKKNKYSAEKIRKW